MVELLLLRFKKERQLAGSSSKKQKSREFNCTKCSELASTLDPQLCFSLPAFHVYTGCDCTADFYNKGKARPFKIFSKNKKFQIVFASLTDDADLLLEQKMEAVQEFTCLMYGVTNCINVNDARYRLFQKDYASVKSDDNFLIKIKSFDSTLIPPCWKSLKQKVLRTIFVNSMCLSATDADCIKLNPEECGWFMENHLKPRWFDGDATPLQIDDISQEKSK